MSSSTDQGSIQQAAIIARALEDVFRKLIRLLMGRMSLVKLQEMIRIIFVEEAEQHLNKERPGNSISMTKMALLTGLDTRTLAKIIEEKNQLPSHKERGFTKNLTTESNILDVWSTNQKYMDKHSGRPKILNIVGGTSSFETLMKEAGSYRGVTVKSILENLENSESIKFNRSNQTVELLNSRYLPFRQKKLEVVLRVALVTFNKLLGTFLHNSEIGSTEENSFFQRSNWTSRLSLEDQTKARKSLKDYLVASEAGAIELLKQFEEEQSSNDQITVGISMFNFEDERM